MNTSDTADQQDAFGMEETRCPVTDRPFMTQPFVALSSCVDIFLASVQPFG